ncbi:MAG TPA: hypothetical protein VM101_07790 [Flavitalea sp.]|nr:hypothetical protein [Flavitalea sp.]
MKYLFTLFTITITISLYAQHSLEKKWETDSTLKTPESVLFDALNQVLYTSNIDGKADEKDGKGSIGKVGLDGKIIATDWVAGLNAPKGMALVKNTLWVADLDELVAIDITKGEIARHIKIPGAVFLNDVAADTKGNIYVTDSRKKELWKMENDKPAKLLDSTSLKGPNGVLVYNKDIYILDNGGLYRLGKGKSLDKLADGMEGRTDGVENVQGNEFIVSCWQGVIYYVNGDGTTQKLIDTRDQQLNSADIGYDPKNRIVYVPGFFRNKIVAYGLK